MNEQPSPTPSQALRILAPIALVVLAVAAMIYMAFSQ
jgi:hypothetical protein